MSLSSYQVLRAIDASFALLETEPVIFAAMARKADTAYEGNVMHKSLWWQREFRLHLAELQAHHSYRKAA